MTTVLAAREWSNEVWIIVVCSVILLVGLGLLVGVWLYGRRWLKEASPEDSREPWTLHDLRQLRDSGQISETEFQAMRAAMIRSYRSTQSVEDGNEAGPDN